MKVSIIVPVYKVEQCLARCITSIIDQSFQDYELILVDDGSPDASGKICELFSSKYSKIKVIHQNNQGLSAARNTGLNIARGEYVTFIDSDDVIHFQYLEILVNEIERNHADIAMCDFIRCENFINVECRYKKEIENYHVDILTPNIAINKYFDEDINHEVPKFVSACWKLYRRSLFDNIRYPYGRLFEDEYVTYKLMYISKKIVVIDKPLYYYMVNHESITQTLSIQKKMDEYTAQLDRISFFSEKSEYIYKKAILKYLQTAQWDFKEVTKMKNKSDSKLIKFQQEYIKVFKLAKEKRYISFCKNYDYYVLANPNKKFLYRIRRWIFKFFGFM